MPALMLRVVLVLLLAAPAFADGTNRVLLADGDRELQRALETVLAPWRLQVVVDANAPVDAPQVHANARFVVWRENGELVVYDRERGDRQHRRAPDGALDPASAAAAALTVKTLMRLPAPDAATADTATTPVIREAAQAEPRGTLLRVQAALATRMAPGDRSLYDGRAGLAVFVQPAGWPLRIGIAGELGTTSTIKDGGFRGTWRDWHVMGLASRAISVGTWEIEPHVGAGVLRTKLDGEEALVEHHERETLLVLRAGVFARVQLGRFSVGGVLAFDAVPGTRTYNRAGNGSQFFEIPPAAFSLGLILAADLGR